MDVLSFLAKRGIRFSAEKPVRGSDSPLDCHSTPLTSNPFYFISKTKDTPLRMMYPFIFGGERGMLPCFASPLCLATVRRAHSTRLRTNFAKNMPLAYFLYARCPLRVRILTHKNRDTLKRASLFSWRRERDSNPRTGISRYTISNRAPSTNSAISPTVFNYISVL